MIRIIPQEDEHYYLALIEEVSALSKKKTHDIQHHINNMRIRWNKGPSVDYNLKLKYTKRFEKAIEQYLNLQLQIHKQEKKYQVAITQQQQVIKKLNHYISNSTSTTVGKKQLEIIQSEWKQITLMPHPQIENLTHHYQKIITSLKEKPQPKSNYIQETHIFFLKACILDKIEQKIKQVPTNPDWEYIETTITSLKKEFQSLLCPNLHENNNLNTRLQNLIILWEQKRRKQDEEYRCNIEKLINKKKSLVEKAQNLIKEDNLAIAKYKLNHYHYAWKKLSNLLPKEENELWELLKKATQMFYQRLDQYKEHYNSQHQELESKLIEEISTIEKFIKEENWQEGHLHLSSQKSLYRYTYYIYNTKLAKLGVHFRNLYDKFYSLRRLSIKKQIQTQKEQLEIKNQLLNNIKQLIQEKFDDQTMEKIKTYQKEFEAIILPKYMVTDLLKQQKTLWKTIHQKQYSDNDMNHKQPTKNKQNRIKEAQLMHNINILKENLLNIKDTSGKNPYVQKLKNEINKKQQELKDVFYTKEY